MISKRNLGCLAFGVIAALPAGRAIASGEHWLLNDTDLRPGACSATANGTVRVQQGVDGLNELRTLVALGSDTPTHDPAFTYQGKDVWVISPQALFTLSGKVSAEAVPSGYDVEDQYLLAGGDRELANQRL